MLHHLTQFFFLSHQNAPDNEIAQISVESGKVEVDLSDAMMRLVADEQVQINTSSNEYVKKKADHPRNHETK